MAQGPYAELKDKGIDFSQYILKGKEDEDGEEGGESGNPESQEEGEENNRKAARSKNKKKEAKKKEKAKSAATAKELEGSDSSSAQQLMTEEEQATQGVAWSTYFRYLRALLSPVEIVFFFLLTAIAEGVQAFASYWLGKIGSPDEFEEVSFWWKVAIYVLLGAGILVLLTIRSFWGGAAIWRACNKIHDDLLKHVMKCPEVFFNTTPLGRILNRFSGDMTAADQQVFMIFMMVITIWLQLIGNVVVIAIDTVFFLYIGLPVLVVFYLLLIIYQRSSRNLQRIESISRSPVISLFGETVSGAGLSTIRAYHLEENWRARFNALNDAWTVRTVIFREGQKWASMVASLISAIFMGGVVIIGWYNMKAANLAVAINASMAFGAMGVMLVQMNVELESNMTSLERVFFYSTKLPQETDEPNVKEPEPSWPAEGKVEFDHVSFRYRPGLPYVLNDVSMKLGRGEKVGVCGRTGAGKSSLLFALFRLIELNPALQPKVIDIDTGMPIENTFNEPPNKGRVLIDGVDIAKVPLSRLRSSVSIIPQDPTLFTGTVRYNLDLAGRCSDDRIWEVLNMIQMQQAIAELPQGLDTQVAEGGSNFSCGQRQLLCFARAILNDCRIVIMDEATASVDVETDAKIQDTIKNQFKAQTVIVIAHRLNTILGSDRILVMDSGRVSEFDTPENLQNNPNSAFNGLLQSLTH